MSMLLRASPPGPAGLGATDLSLQTLLPSRPGFEGVSRTRVRAGRVSRELPVRFPEELLLGAEHAEAGVCAEIFHAPLHLVLRGRAGVSAAALL